jgi:hypothetical protein
MRKCKYCNNEYPESFFGVALTTPNKVYLRRKCKFCYGQTKNALRNKNRDFIIEYRKKSKCEICGVSDYRVLDFHHREKNKKDFTIAWAYNNIGIAKIVEEIKKCAILCANCHRIVHWQDKKRGVK